MTFDLQFKQVFKIAVLLLALYSNNVSSKTLSLPSPKSCKLKLIENGIAPDKVALLYLNEEIKKELAPLSKRQRNRVVSTLQKMLIINMMSPADRKKFVHENLSKYSIQERKFFYEAIEASIELEIELEQYANNKPGIIGKTLDVSEKALLGLLKHSLKATAYISFVGLLTSVNQQYEELEEQRKDEKKIDDLLGEDTTFFENAKTADSPENKKLLGILKTLPENFTLKNGTTYKKTDSFNLASGEKIIFYNSQGKNGIHQIAINVGEVKNVHDGFKIILSNEDRLANKIFSFNSNFEFETKMIGSNIYPEIYIFEDGSLEQIKRIVPKVHAIPTDGKNSSGNVNVAILDSGIDYSRNELMKNVLGNPKDTPFDGIDNDRNGFTDDYLGYSEYNNNVTHSFPWDYHGTQVTEIALKDTQKTKFLPLLSLGNKKALEQSLKYLKKWNQENPNSKIRVANLSFTAVDINQTTLNLFKENSDILFVAGGGNKKEGSADNHAFPAELDLPNLISVGAVDANKQIAGFSARGKNTDLFALGVGVVTKDPYGRDEKIDGTSFSAPQVTNAALKLLEIDQTLTPTEIKKILLESTTKIPELKGYSLSGGVLNLEAAIKVLKSRKSL